MSFLKSTFSSNNSTTTLNSAAHATTNSGPAHPGHQANSQNGTPAPAKKSLTYILSTTNEHDNKGHHSIGVNSLLFNQADKCLVSGGRDGQISIWKFNHDSNENYESMNKTDNDFYDNLRTNEDVRNHIFKNLDNEVEFEKLESSINSGISSVSIPRATSSPYYYKNSYLHHFGWINDMKLLDDDQTIVSCSNDLSIKLWNYNSNSKLTLGYHDDYIKKLGFTKKFNNQLVSAGLDKVVKLWDIQRGESISSYKFQDYNSSIYSLDVCNNLIICSGPSNIISLFDRRDLQKPVKTFFGHTDNVRSLILREGSFLSGSSDTTIKLWDLRSTRNLRTFEMHNSPVWSLYCPNYSDKCSIFYSADKSGLLLKTDLRSSNLNSKDIPGGYFNYKVNESLGISTVIANVNSSGTSNTSDSTSINEVVSTTTRTSTNADYFSCGINDMVETDELGTIWTATSSNIHNSNTNFITGWSIPQTGKLVVHQGLVLNRKLASIYNTNENDLMSISQNNGQLDKIKSNESINDTEDLVSQLSADDLDHIDNALFSNSNGLDKILQDQDNSSIFNSKNTATGTDVKEFTDSDSSSFESDECVYNYATCFLGFLGNLNTQYLFADDYIGEDDNASATGDDNSLDPFSISDPTYAKQTIKKNRQIEINNNDIDENNVLLLPFNNKPISVISGRSGLVKSKILNNRRHVATMDQTGCVYVFDIILGKLIQRVDSHLSINSIDSVDTIQFDHRNKEEVLENNDDLNLSDRFEAVCEKFQTQETLPSWCSAQVNSGQLFITLKENTFAACDIYSDDFFEYYKECHFSVSANSSTRVNLGKFIIITFFGELVRSFMLRNNIESYEISASDPNLQESGTSLIASIKNNSNTVNDGTHNATQNIKIPQPTPNTRSYSTSADKSTSKRGIFGRLKQSRKDTPQVLSSLSSSSPHQPNVNLHSKLDSYVEKINRINHSAALIKFIKSNPDVLSVLRTQYGYSEKQRDSLSLSLLKRRDYETATLVVINEETAHETRPSFTIDLGRLNGEHSENDDKEAILSQLPVWILKGLMLNIYPVCSSMTVKIGFVVMPEKDCGVESVDQDDTVPRLNAVSSLRVSRILEFVREKLPEGIEGLQLELLCKGQVLAAKDTLGTVKARVWKQGGDVELTYRTRAD